VDYVRTCYKYICSRQSFSWKNWQTYIVLSETLFFRLKPKANNFLFDTSFKLYYLRNYYMKMVTIYSEILISDPPLDSSERSGSCSEE
jgi:hypothetical protein